jgi:hypothetical protein
MKVDVDQPKRQLIRANETGSRVVFSRAVVHLSDFFTGSNLLEEAPTFDGLRNFVKFRVARSL